VSRTSVTDSGLHSIAWVPVGVSVLVLVLIMADRRLAPGARVTAECCRC